MEDSSGTTAGKGRYHHGDLRNALIDAAVGLARAGGPDAVVLRAAARRVGVSPTAAYRHFAGQPELLFAVKEAGQQRLAERMEAAVRAVPDTHPRAVEERMLAMGRGYIGFALDEPGLFRSAFCHTADDVTRLPAALSGEAPPAPGGGPTVEGMPGADADEWQFRSFRMLVEILDGLVDAGRMPPARRPGAEVTAWSMVHGLSTLVLDGPFAPLTEEQRDAAVDIALRTLVAGFTAP
ncbi:TetR/AcrR family transcriptional regulator [Streptomyces phytohabitans]|uniref:TetR/AcrR family transcriptional regulator n=1 Tax=Streptomyces phytohabitans TaxID=1150371 RepID=UPI00345BE3FD